MNKKTNNKMFWKRKAKCPITIEDQKWITEKLNWLDTNVIDLQSQPTILPTRQHFNYQFRRKEEDADFVLKKVGEYFKINTDKINLDFYSEEAIELDRGMITQKEEGTGTAGYYYQDGDSYSILIEIQQLMRPDSLIATMAHELSHYVLIGQKGIYNDGDENEWLTDLLAIAFGFGIFIGNTKFTFGQWQSADGWGGWSTSSQGYLPQQVTAHAMAEIEIARGHKIPDWINYLQGDFKSDFKRSMEYLMENEK